MSSAPPTKATDAVLVASEPIPDGVQQVKGIDWMSLPAEQRNIISNFVDQLTGQGFQSSSIGDAIRIINDMVGQSVFEVQARVASSSDCFPEIMERPRVGRKDDHLSGLYIQYDIIRLARDLSLSGPTPPRVRHCHDRWWC